MFNFLKRKSNKNLDVIFNEVRNLKDSHIASQRVQQTIIRLYEDKRKKEKRLDTIIYILNDIIKSNKIENNLNKYLRALNEVCCIDRCYIYVNQPNEKRFKLQYEKFNATRCESKKHLDLFIDYESISCIHNKISDGILVDGNTQNLNDEIINKKESSFANVESVLLIPIFVDNVLWGFLGFEHLDVYKFTKEEKDLYNILSGVIGSTMRKQELFEFNEFMIRGSAGYIWYKDEDHKYILCDPSFCNDFFKLNVKSIHDIYGKTDNELISRCNCYHSFFNICVSTDEHCKSQGYRCRYIEIGYIDNQLFVFDVVKTPLFDKFGNYNGNIGFAKRIKFTFFVDILERQIDHGKVEILHSDHKSRIYWIREEKFDDINTQSIDIFP